MVWTKVATPKIATVLCLGMVLIIPGLARGADPIGKMSLSARFGIGGFKMARVNDAISDSNHRISELQPEWKVPDRIHSGFDFVAEAAYDFSDALRFGIIYGSTSGATSVDYLQAINVEPSGAMVIPRLFYRLPWRPMIDMSLRLFAGFVYLTSVETNVDHENTSSGDSRIEIMNIKGSGSGFMAGVAGEYTLSDTFALAMEAGYRAAKADYDSGSWRIENVIDPLGDPDNDGRPNIRDPLDHSYLWGFMNELPEDLGRGEEPTVRPDLDTDFSGFQIQIGLRAYIF